MLPHRHPLVLLDGVTDIEAGVSGTGLKNVSVSDPVFAGHFPGTPIYPGVYMIEAAAQTSGIVAAAAVTAETSIGYLASVRRFNFRTLVVPGDRLSIDVRRGSAISGLVEFRCALRVDGRPVADGSIALALGVDG